MHSSDAMADLATQMRAKVWEILRAADLDTTTSRKVRSQVGESLGIEDMNPHRKLVEAEVEKFLAAKEVGPLPDVTPAEKRKRSEAGPSHAGGPAQGGQNVFVIGSKRRVIVKSFKERVMVDVREFYEKDGELKPAAKGLALSLEQWAALRSAAAAASAALAGGEFGFEAQLSAADSRKLSVETYKGNPKVSLREFYEKDGKSLPGKKGISLSAEEWASLTEQSDAINERVEALTASSAGPPKKSKTEPAAASGQEATAAPAEPSAVAAKAAGNAAGGEDGAAPAFVELSGNRRAAVSEFKGSRLLSLREYYSKNNEMLPGKKGISLREEQARKLLSHRQALSDALADKRDTSVDLGSRRYAKVSAYKGNFSVDVREYYEKDGEEKPTPKGLSMPQEQWTALAAGLDALIRQM